MKEEMFGLTLGPVHSFAPETISWPNNTAVFCSVLEYGRGHRSLALVRRPALALLFSTSRVGSERARLPLLDFDPDDPDPFSLRQLATVRYL